MQTSSLPTAALVLFVNAFVVSLPKSLQYNPAEIR